LVVVRRIVESSGGRVRAVASPDGGVFHVDLPDAVVGRDAQSQPVLAEQPQR
jgi:signal transduction histidine kinase